MDLAADITPEDLKVFLEEAEEHLQLLDEDLIRLEREDDRTEILQEIFRAAHTIKGSSAMLGYAPMTEVAHAMEGVLDKLRQDALAVTTEVIDGLLHGLDVLRLLKDELISSQGHQVDTASVIMDLEKAAAARGDQDQTPIKPTDHKPLTLDGRSLERLHAAKAAGKRIYRIIVSFDPDTLWLAVRCFQVLSELSPLGEVLGSVPSQTDIEQEKGDSEIQVILATVQDEDELRNAVTPIDDLKGIEIAGYELKEDSMAAKAIEPSSTGPVTRAPSQLPHTVRIDVDRLDHLMDTIGELVIDRTRLIQIGKALEARYKDDQMVQALSVTSAHVVKVVDELEEVALKIRMQPIGTVFSGFPRMVRDLAQSATKQLDFFMEGQETEIDRTVIERIRDPLVHLLRNSVDHGIEGPDERIAANKPERGMIRLSAHHEQGHIMITVQDNGRGISAQHIRESAIDKGLITAEVATRLSDSEAVDLIFTPGFSTAERTTEVSGRGVGMDIVKTNIEAMNGFVSVETREGQGSKFTLQLPLSLATIQALLVSLADTVYAVPLVYVSEAVRLESEEIHSVGGNEFITLRGRVLPLLRLKEIFNIGPQGQNGDGATYVVVVRSGEKTMALAVDALVESQEIMVKSLGDYIGTVKGIAGISVLGDGQVVLIVDVPPLLSAAASRAA